MSSAREALLEALSPVVVDALLELVDERVAAMVGDVEQHGNGVSPWFSVAGAAEYLGVSERKVERMVAAGRVRSATVGRRRLFHRDDLDRAATGEEQRQPLHPATASSRLRGANRSE